MRHGPKLGVLTVEQFRTGEIFIPYQFVHDILTDSLGSDSLRGTVVSEGVDNSVNLDKRLVGVFFFFHASIIHNQDQECKGKPGKSNRRKSLCGPYLGIWGRPQKFFVNKKPAIKLSNTPSRRDFRRHPIGTL